MSGYIGTQPVPQATQHRESFTATSGQTSFATAGYTPQFLDVYLNGIHLVNGDDYTATNGSDVVLTTGAATDDVLEVVSYTPFEVADQTFTGTTTVVDSNAAPLVANRQSSDGSIVDFKKDGTTVGSIGVASSQLEIEASASNLVFKNPTRAMAFTTGSFAGAGSANDAVIDLGISNRRFKDLYLSGGVYLGGTGAANLLDDYEEGIFNVELWAGGTQLALSEYGGSYVKVGNLVTVNFEADCSNTNGASGSLAVRGMPFTIADVLSPTGIEANGSVSYWQNWSTSINSPSLYAEGGTTLLYVMGSTSSTAASNANLTAANIGTGEFRGTITYRTT